MSTLSDAKPPPAVRQHSNEEASEDEGTVVAGSNRFEPARLALSIEEASNLLGISRSLGYELAAQGRIPTIRLGRRIVVARAALERLLDGDSDASSGVVHRTP
jgi:excisionase family DNA binding protein